MTSLFAYIAAKAWTTRAEREAIENESFSQLAQDQYDLITPVWFLDASGLGVY